MSNSNLCVFQTFQFVDDVDRYIVIIHRTTFYEHRLIEEFYDCFDGKAKQMIQTNSVDTCNDHGTREYILNGEKLILPKEPKRFGSKPMYGSHYLQQVKTSPYS